MYSIIQHTYIVPDIFCVLTFSYFITRILESVNKWSIELLSFKKITRQRIDSDTCCYVGRADYYTTIVNDAINFHHWKSPACILSLMFRKSLSFRAGIKNVGFIETTEPTDLVNSTTTY